MKLYCWRAKTYDEEAFVIAESEDAARQALLAQRVQLPTEPKPVPPHDYSDQHELWLKWFHAEYTNKKIRRILSGDEHELIVLEPNQVAWAEKS